MILSWWEWWQLSTMLVHRWRLLTHIRLKSCSIRFGGNSNFISNLNIQTFLQSFGIQSPILIHLKYVCVFYLSFFFVFSFIKIYWIQTTAQMDDFVFFMIFIYRKHKLSIQFYNLFFFLFYLNCSLFLLDFVGFFSFFFYFLLILSCSLRINNSFFCFNFHLNYLLVFLFSSENFIYHSIVCCFF